MKSCGFSLILYYLHLIEPPDTELSLTVLDLLEEGLQGHDHWLCKERVVQVMKAVLGKALDRSVFSMMNISGILSFFDDFK